MNVYFYAFQKPGKGKSSFLSFSVLNLGRGPQIYSLPRAPNAHCPALQERQLLPMTNGPQNLIQMLIFSATFLDCQKPYIRSYALSQIQGKERM